MQNKMPEHAHSNIEKMVKYASQLAIFKDVKEI